MEVANPVLGRPTKYRPEYCETVIECGKIGMSKVEMACECDVTTYETLTEWAEKYPIFSEALKKATMLSKAWWEKQGRIGVFDAEGQRLNASYTKQMAARFPESWRDNSGIELSGRLETVAVAKFAERDDG